MPLRYFRLGTFLLLGLVFFFAIYKMRFLKRRRRCYYPFYDVTVQNNWIAVRVNLKLGRRIYQDTR